PPSRPSRLAGASRLSLLASRPTPSPALADFTDLPVRQEQCECTGARSYCDHESALDFPASRSVRRGRRQVGERGRRSCLSFANDLPMFLEGRRVEPARPRTFVENTGRLAHLALGIEKFAEEPV